MNQFVKLAITVFLGLYVFAGVSQAAPNTAMPRVTTEMLFPQYWYNKLDNPDKIILNEAAIRDFNAEIIKKMPTTAYDLKQYPDSLKKEELITLLKRYEIPEDPRYYQNNLRIEKIFYDKLKEQINLEGVKAENPVQYGFSVKRTNIRTFPTTEKVLESPNDIEFDQFQETTIEAAEPVIVLKYSKDGQWLYIQTYNYLGWVEAQSIAVTDKTAWTDYQNNPDFLVVTGNEIRLGFNPYSPELSELAFGMGQRLPLAKSFEHSTLVDNQSVAGNYVIKLPIRKSDGQAAFNLALVSASQDVCEGFLPYTRANVIKQAFKMQGQRYGWGGDFKGRDCSALIQDIYAVFGFKLPRNADEQENSIGLTTVFNESMTLQERRKILKQLQPGAALYMRGHVMLYLGEEAGRYFVIHDMAAQGNPEKPQKNGTYLRVPVNQVTVSDLDIIRTNGKCYLESLRTVKEYRE